MASGSSAEVPAAPRARASPLAFTRTSTAATLAIVTAIAAALRLASFAHVPPTPFYGAAVRSMGQSWHNFFYGAFEPSAQVSIDKIPVDLWLEVVSVKLFGFSSTATRLPEALAGVLAVPLLYDLVRRLFGRTAGLGAATALAVMQDDGPVVPQDERQLIFERFRRGRTSAENGAGFGLGLAIGRQLAEQMDGELQLLETPSGASFVVSLDAAVEP